MHFSETILPYPVKKTDIGQRTAKSKKNCRPRFDDEKYTKNIFEIFEAVSTELAAVRQVGRQKGTWDEASSPSRPQDGRWDGEGPKSAVGPGASPAPAIRGFAREQRAALETARPHYLVSAENVGIPFTLTSALTICARLLIRKRYLVQKI